MVPSAAETRRPEPCVVVIFGASGDLTRRKLLPGLWNLHCEGQLPEGFAVVGVGRTPMSDDEFRKTAEEGIREFSRFREADPEQLRKFTDYLFYLRGEYNAPETYQNLRGLLSKVCDLLGACGNHLYYLATRPADTRRSLGSSEGPNSRGTASSAAGPASSWRSPSAATSPPRAS
jgi:glucose-6-phosphate 1-dehydrogenase